MASKRLKAEYLLEGDVTPDGVVVDVLGIAGEVVVEFEDGTTKRYKRAELVDVE
jgi:hypothetical protein